MVLEKKGGGTYLVSREVEGFPQQVLLERDFDHLVAGSRCVTGELVPRCLGSQAEGETSDPGEEPAVEMDESESQSHDYFDSLDHWVGLLLRLFLLHVPRQFIQLPRGTVWIAR